jgi:GDP-mannose 6-dehydrogenase
MTGSSMTIAQPIEAFRPQRAPFVPVVIAEKPAISVIGLGYVGAVSCGCLAALGHRVIGVDIDAGKVAAIAAGKAPIHEAGLDELLAQGLAQGRIDATADLAAAVAGTDVTFVSVGTPTAEDGGCNTRHIAAAAEAIGLALRDKAGFHIVVLRCSVPPGTTHGLMAQRIEALSGKALGTDFGIAFVPEFLREGVAVEDFHAPARTVIGASDERTSATVARIFAPVDPEPLLTGIETAELVKYVDNVWHAAKVCFANEVGRLSKAVGVDGRRVMDIFVRDTKLNLSPYYLKPGFAYGGSCLPKEVRAVSHLAGQHGIRLPLVESLGRSNAEQIETALRMVRATGARRVAVLGLAFKPGTDDLRESPILEVMAALMDEGVALAAHDRVLGRPGGLDRPLEALRGAPPALARLAAALPGLVEERAEAAIAGAEAVIVAHSDPGLRALLAASGLPVIDLVGLFAPDLAPRGCEGIGW